MENDQVTLRERALGCVWLPGPVRLYTDPSCRSLRRLFWFAVCSVSYKVNELNEMNGLHDFPTRRKSFKSFKSCILYDTKQTARLVKPPKGAKMRRSGC